MNFSKTPKGGAKPAVRQMRGPGMNKGLKKPRYGKFSKAETGAGSATPSRTSSAKELTPSEKPSYLSQTLVPTGGNPTREGKVLSSKTF